MIATINSIVVDVVKMGNTVPKAGLVPTSLAFQARVLTLHHIGFPDVTTIPMPTFLEQSGIRGTGIELFRIWSRNHDSKKS